MILELGALIAEISSIQKYGWNAGINHGHFETANSGNFQCIDQITCWKHRTAFSIVISWIQKLDLYFGRRKGYTIQFEITQLLHLTILHRHMGYNGFLNIGLPNTYRA